MKRLLLHPTLLVSLHVFCLTVLIFAGLHADYEDWVYDRILETSLQPSMSPQESVEALLHTTHRLVASRRSFVGVNRPPNLRRSLFLSGDSQLQEGGACGTQVHVLGRLLQRAGYRIRIAQMRCGDILACHIVLEVLLDGEWVVLDPLYSLAFRKQDGSLASFAEVSAGWSHFKYQVPSDYDPKYAYKGVRYANWSKIPVVLPLVKRGLMLILGPDVEYISLRTYILNGHRALYSLVLCLYGGVLLLTGISIVLGYRARRRQHPLRLHAGGR